jgi:hypothetical protein
MNSKTIQTIANGLDQGNREFEVNLEFLWNLGVGRNVTRHEQRRHRPDLASYHDSRAPVGRGEVISWLSSNKAPNRAYVATYRVLLENTTQPEFSHV